MPSRLQTPRRYYEEQQALATVTVAGATKLWRQMDDDFDDSWARLRSPMLQLVQRGRLAVAQTSAGYTESVLAETEQTAPPAGELVPAAFIASAPDGRDMSTLLDGAVYEAKTAVSRGQAPAEARATAGRWLTGTLLTVMADTGRGVVGADIISRPAVGGYVRMLNTPSCSRCIILAGKWFRWNDGFLRHPRCDCRHIPAAEDTAGDLTTDPYEYFKSLSPEEQEKLFGRSEARAIRDGGDIFRVVNTKNRGLATAKAAKKYGTPSRMTVDDIYRTAGTRTNAIKMLEREGYITGPQTRDGNIVGRLTEGFGQLGKGGRARAASDAVTAARTTGVRDPLNRYTMTAAERNLYDAKVRLDEAVRTGNWPQSIGANSADKYSTPRPLRAGELDTLRANLSRQLAKVQGTSASSSTRTLARALGLL